MCMQRNAKNAQKELFLKRQQATDQNNNNNEKKQRTERR